jgi:hypothetical protein
MAFKTVSTVSKKSASSNIGELVGSVALWAKTSSKGTKFLSGFITLTEDDDSKIDISLFRNESGKAVLKGKIVDRDEEGQPLCYAGSDKQIVVAWISLFKNEGKGEHTLYGYVNPDKNWEGEQLSYFIKVFKSQLSPESKKPTYTGEVYELLTEDSSQKVAAKPAPKATVLDVDF